MNIKQAASATDNRTPGLDPPRQTGRNVLRGHGNRKKRRGAAGIHRQRSGCPTGIVQQTGGDATVKDIVPIGMLWPHVQPALPVVSIRNVDNISDQGLRAGFIPDQMRFIWHRLHHGAPLPRTCSGASWAVQRCRVNPAPLAGFSGGEQGNVTLQMMIGVAKTMIRHSDPLGNMGQLIFLRHRNAAVHLNAFL